MSALVQYDVVGFALHVIELWAASEGCSAEVVCASLVKLANQPPGVGVAVHARSSIVIPDYLVCSDEQLVEWEGQMGNTNAKVARVLARMRDAMREAGVDRAFITVPVGGKGHLRGALTPPVFACAARNLHSLPALASVGDEPTQTLEGLRKEGERAKSLARPHVQGVAAAGMSAIREMGFQTATEALTDPGVLGSVATRLLAGLVWAAAAFARAGLGAMESEAVLAGVAFAISQGVLEALQVDADELVCMAILTTRRWTANCADDQHARAVFKALEASEVRLGTPYRPPSAEALGEAVGALLAIELAERRERAALAVLGLKTASRSMTARDVLAARRNAKSANAIVTTNLTACGDGA